MSKQNTLGSVREIWSIAYPVIMSTASTTIMRFMDRMMLSWSSPDDIAASTPADIASFTIICLFIGIASYTNALIAQYHGANDKEYLSKSLWQAIYFSLFAGIIIILFIPIGNLFINSMDHSASVIEKEKQYFTVLMYGGGFSVLGCALGSFFTGRGDTKTTMYISFIGCTLNFILGWALIFGNLGFPKLEILGAGIATDISLFVIALLYILCIFRKKYINEFNLIKYYRYNKELFIKLMRYGIPAGVEFMLGIASFAAFVFMVGNLGKDQLIASNIALSIDMLAFMPLIGLGIATESLVGQYIGRNLKNVAVKVTYNSMKLSVIYTFIVGALFLIIPDFFLAFFVDNKETTLDSLIVYGEPLLRIVTILLLIDGVAIVLANSLAGSGDTFYKMMVQIITGWILFVPGIYVLFYLLNKDVVYGWWWLIVYYSVYTLIVYFRYRSGKWKEFDLISREASV